MSHSSSHSRKTESSKKTGMLDTVLIIRLVIATVIFAVSLILELPGFVSTVLLILAAATAGYDIVLDALKHIDAGEYFSTPAVVILVAVLSFVIGFGIEGAALIVLYQIGLVLIAYATERTQKSALELLQYNDVESREQVERILMDEESCKLELEASTGNAASFILKLAMVFAVIFAAVTPILTNMSYTVSIHRALTIVLVATPMSVVLAMPLTGRVALCYAAQFGTIFRSAGIMEKTALTKTAVVDKAGVLTEDCPRLTAVVPSVLDKDTFMTFAAHAVYYSSQPFARAISSAWNQEYQLELVDDFVDIPGCGVDLRIGGAKVTLANRNLFVSRGVNVPFEEIANNLVLYMTVSDRYVGYIAISDTVKSGAEAFVSELKATGITKCILLAEEGSEASESLASQLEFDEFYAQCDTGKKLKLIEDLASADNAMVYIHSSGIGTHSAALTDMRVSTKGKYADAIVRPDSASNLPNALRVCGRMRQIAAGNAIFAFAIKALLIFLSITGFCNIWFAIFIDMIAAVATILNTIRVTSNPIVNIKL